MPKFMMILHETPNAFRQMAPEEMQRVMERYRAWFDKIKEAGRTVTSDKLAEDGGKVLSKQQGRLSVVDGPYSEAKEVIGGYLMFRAASYDEALELVADCPHLEFGRLSLRQADPMSCGGE